MRFDTDAFDDHHDAITARVAGAVPVSRSARTGRSTGRARSRRLDIHIPQSHPLRRGCAQLACRRAGPARHHSPLVVTDPGLIATGLVAQVVGGLGKTSGRLQRIQVQPDRGGRAGRSGSLSQRELRWSGRDGRRQSDRRRQGDPAAGHASGPARRLRLDPGRPGQDQSPPCRRWWPFPPRPAPAARRGEAR